MRPVRLWMATYLVTYLSPFFDLNQAFHAKSHTAVRMFWNFVKKIHLIVIEQYIFISGSSIISESKYVACIWHVSRSSANV